MFLKNRSPSKELRILRSLNPRMNFTPKELKHYLNLEKGYQGELMFDQLTSKLQNQLFVLNDLCFEYNSSVFQIDTLIISQEKIYPFEVKNYEGDYFFDSGSFYTLSTKEEIKNPLEQLKRSTLLLRPLLKNHGIYLPIEGSVSFVNPEFTLYQAPLNAPIIYPNQLNRFMKKLNQIPSTLNERHKKIADLLISLHQDHPPYSRLKPYNYEQLRKGIICFICYSFMYLVGERKLVCEKCRCEEEAESAIIRSVEELKLLFPNIKITTTLVSDWCRVINSRKMIRRVLMENMNATGFGRWFYFE